MHLGCRDAKGGFLGEKNQVWGIDDALDGNGIIVLTRVGTQSNKGRQDPDRAWKIGDIAVHGPNWSRNKFLPILGE